MQTPLVKRTISIRSDSPRSYSPLPFQEPRKKKLQPLTIEIYDSFTEPSSPSINSTSASKSRSPAFKFPKPVLTCKALTSTSPSLQPQKQAKFDFTKVLLENDTKYDEYYREGESYNIGMKRCHRKTMEDRVH
jgi:hypothetical protein